MAVGRLNAPSAPLSLLVLLSVTGFAKMAEGHEHGVSHIEEGNTVSKEPLVRKYQYWVFSQAEKRTDIYSNTGCDHTNSHLNSNDRLWGYFPGRNGSWRKSIFFIIVIRNIKVLIQYLDDQIAMARPYTSCRHSSGNRRLLPRPCPPRSRVRRK